jgi:transposase
MRGDDEQTSHLFSYVSPEQRVPADQPLRAIRTLTDEALRSLSRRFAGLYSTTGRPSIPPEQLLRALVLQVLYTVRSERLLMEELNYNLLFRWFVGLNMDDPVWHPTTFTKNRDRLLAGDVAAAFFDAVRAQARAAGLLSDEHFTVDGTQLEAWASLKSFQPRDAEPGEPPMTPGIPPSTSVGSAGAMPRTPRRPIRRRCCIGKARARKPSWRIWATCCWTIGTGSSPTSGPPTRPARPSAT